MNQFANSCLFLISGLLQSHTPVVFAKEDLSLLSVVSGVISVITSVITISVIILVISTG
jgi:hypothetical protein